MSKKVIIVSVCVLIFLAALKGLSDLALAERGYHAFGGEICLPIFVFAAWVIFKTIKDIVGKDLR